MADHLRMVPMTEYQKRIRELEKKLQSEQNGITIYRTYFRVCAGEETDPQKKRFYEQLANAEDLESLSRIVCPDSISAQAPATSGRNTKTTSTKKTKN